ncbi:EAL domain-containing protein [Egbenema bharatensis]|uniref:EAL domain-containing protein n=1 Tax=Egbenema bharatensis TaxID=3463334 RepID=UPI003A89B050
MFDLIYLYLDMACPLIKVLLVDDDEDDYVLTRDLFAEIQGETFGIDWVATYEKALDLILQDQYDVYLVDYRLGQRSGLELLQDAIAHHCNAPFILLTGLGDHEIDMAAMRAGAADYLLKREMTAAVLERTIRYAVEHAHTLKTLRLALQEKQQLALAISNISTGVVVTDPSRPGNPVVFVNAAFAELTGYTAEETMGRNCRFLQGPDTDPTAIQQIRDAIRQLKPIVCPILNYRKDGTPFWNEVSINPVFDESGKLINFIGLQNDVTSRKRAEAALRESEERYALAVQGANDGIWDWNLKTGEVYFSPRWKSMLGYREHEIGDGIEECLDRIHPEDAHWVKRTLKEHLEGLTSHFEQEYRMQHRDGGYRWILCRGLAVQDQDGKTTRMAGSQTDLTAWKQAEEKLVHDALHDTLTGLPNRVLLMERLRHAIQLFQRSSSLFAVLFIDLDRFKMINDSLGHMLGDHLLISIADRLSHCLRPADTIARLGGDEFVILLEDVRDETAVTLVAERIQQELSVPFDLEGHEVFTAASIGITFGSNHYTHPEELLRDADTAMYRAKEQGRGRYEIFDSRMHTYAVALLQTETDLRRALERQELQLHYQPIVSLRTQQVVSFETLLRWKHPKRGMISPAEFIPIAEDTGLIIPIGRWVLQEACQQMREWQQQFPDQDLSVTVNLSSKQFTPYLTEEISQILSKAELSSHCVKLEITESVLMENAELAITTLSKLQELGIHLAIDDFGTGYSSLSYLHRFPIDTLKIDRSFISKIDSDGEQLAIVRTIITLAWNLGMDVVAEGVETPKQLAQIRALHCDYAQGYFFCKPVEAEAATQLIHGLLGKKVDGW